VVGKNYRLKKQAVFGLYRRHMKTIGHLGHIDEIFCVAATTRSWTMVLSVLRILKSYIPSKASVEDLPIPIWSDHATPTVVSEN
jgi:hypothetical protein